MARGRWWCSVRVRRESSAILRVRESLACALVMVSLRGAGSLVLLGLVVRCFRTREAGSSVS